ncbi:MAG: site-specific integrase [Rhodospirillaceae bacterium]|nr:site-specific integrase [Rhodospirillaceae bacterium]
MAKLKRRRISRSTVERLSVAKDTVYWDSELPGFGVRAYASGSKVYVVQARANGESRRLTLGRHGVISAEEARRRAALAISRIKSGQPGAVSTVESKGPTVVEVAARYLKEHVQVRLKPATVGMIRADLDKHILPKFGSLPMASVGYERIAAYHSKLFGTPAMANRVVETFSAMYSMAETWGEVPEGANPCVRVVRYKRNSPERFLTEAEFERLGRVLGDVEAQGAILPQAAAALRLLMLTGCRCKEILRLRWEEVDLERNELRLSDSKTGPRTVPLSPAAARVLAGRPRVPGDLWVIPGRFPGRPLRNIDRSWRKVRARAGLEDVRMHDLRHSFASRALALGESLPMIGKLLGHTRVQTTARYAHLAEDSVRESAARIAAGIGEDILGGRGEEAQAC